MSDVRCIIFDLDGVLVHTDRWHEAAWRAIAEDEGIEFDPSWRARLRGVDRMSSLEIILERAGRRYSREEKELLANRKNDLYRGAIHSLSSNALVPGARQLLETLRAHDLRIAIASSSRNASLLINRLGLPSLIDASADGSDDVPAKPDPALLLLAARRAGVAPNHCVVIEDAAAGIEGARRAGMRAIFIGPLEGAPPGTLAVISLDAPEILNSILAGA